MKKQSPFLKHLDNIEKYIIWVLFTILLILMFVQVVARYVFSMAWGWMEVFTRLLYVYVTFCGVSYAARGGQHLRVQALATLLPGKYTEVGILLFGDIVLTIFCFYNAYIVWVITYQNLVDGTVFPGATWLKVWIRYFAGCLGMFGCGLRTLIFRVIPKIKGILDGSAAKIKGKPSLMEQEAAEIVAASGQTAAEETVEGGDK